MPDNRNPEQPAARQQIINNAGAYKITIPYFNPDKYQNKENDWISATTWIRQVEQAVKAAGKKADGLQGHTYPCLYLGAEKCPRKRVLLILYKC